MDPLCLAAGLRLGEATALHWKGCWFGTDASNKRISNSSGISGASHVRIVGLPGTFPEAPGTFPCSYNP